MFDAVSIPICRWLIETLGHSLWQACLIAVACWLVLRMLPARQSNLRYSISCIGLLAIVATSLVTVSVVAPGADVASRPSAAVLSNTLFHATDTPSELSEPSTPRFESSESEASARAVSNSTAAAGKRDVAASHPDQWLLALTAIWAAGALMMLLRIGRSMLQVRRLRAEDGEESVNSGLLERVHQVVTEVSERLRLRFPVAVSVTSRVQVPGVVGTIWPVLLMPPALLTGVPLNQLRIVIAHELAHVRRMDFLVNLAQMLIEALLFFNPAVWWMSRQIRIEREACCDALAVSATGEAIPVARALVDVVARLRESIGETAANGFALAAGVQQLVDGSGPDSSLFDRVRRIIAPEQRPHVRLPWYSLFGFLIALAALSAGLYEGTAAAVQVVRQALSPPERIETMARLQAENTGIFTTDGSDATEKAVSGQPPAEQTEPSDKPAGNEKAANGKVTINVRVRTDDGSPVPKGTQLIADYRTGNHSNTETIGVVNKDMPEYVTSLRVPSCRFVVGGYAPGLAPFIAKPLTIFAKEGDRTVEIVLTRGFETSIRFVDTSGTPVPNALVKLSGRIGLEGSGWSSVGSREVTADDQGVASIERLSKMVYIVDVRAAGYQHAQHIVRFKPGVPSTVELKPAKPTSLLLVDDETQQPVSGARAILFARVYEEGSRKGTHGSGDPRENTSGTIDKWRVFGESDPEGRIMLSELQERSHYLLAIQAEGYGTTFVTEVRGETKNNW